MPRKPNYRFERLERERTKAAKKAERAKLKADRAEQAKSDADPDETRPADAAAAPADNE